MGVIDGSGETEYLKPIEINIPKFTNKKSSGSSWFWVFLILFIVVILGLNYYSLYQNSTSYAMYKDENKKDDK